MTLPQALRNYHRPFPRGPFSTIVIDPPWKYQKNPGPSRRGPGRGGMAEHQYPTMTVEEIVALPIASACASQAHLYLWTTNPQLFGGRFSNISAKEILEAWGFTYITMLTWVKPGGGGLGWYFRGQTEHVIFGTRGNLQIPPSKREINVITAKRRRHSQKPEEFYSLVERVSPGPYLELFARTHRPGWTCWGDEL